MIVNMDEMLVYFDLLPGKTVNQKGDKSVLQPAVRRDISHVFSLSVQMELFSLP